MVFTLNGCSYEVTERFRITTLELGCIEVYCRDIQYTKGTVVSLDLGFIKTQLPCIAYNGPYNAKLSLYSNGEGYNTLQLAYHCSCSYSQHSHCLTWFDLQIDGFDISASSLGYHFNQVHNHPVVNSFSYLKPKPKHVRKGPVWPDPETGKHGQFLLAF